MEKPFSCRKRSKSIETPASEMSMDDTSFMMQGVASHHER
jgi:hypothetical protein